MNRAVEGLTVNKMKKTAIFLLAALLIAAIPIASTLAASNGDLFENQKALPIHNTIQKQDREQLKDRECPGSSPADSGACMTQERAQLRVQEREMIHADAGSSDPECQSFIFPLREMLQLRNQNCIGYGK